MPMLNLKPISHLAVTQRSLSLVTVNDNYITQLQLEGMRTLSLKMQIGVTVLVSK